VLFTFLPPLLQYLSLQNVKVLGYEYYKIFCDITPCQLV